MAEKKLKASLIIGGLIDSSFKTVLTDTKSGFSQLGSTIKQVSRYQRDMRVEMDRMREAGESITGMKARYDGLTGAIKRAEQAQTALRRAEATRNRLNGAAEQSRFMAGRAGAGALAGGLVLRNLLGESSAFQTENARLQVMGVPDEAKKQALAAGQSLKTFGTTIRENVEAYNDGLAVFGNMHEAAVAAPLMAKMKFANGALFGTSNEESERQLKDMLRVIDLRGGASNAAEFQRQAGFIQQAMIASKGMVNGSEFFKLVSHGGTAVKGMSNESIYYKLLPLIQEMKGDQLGTALQTSYNSLIQGHTSKRAAINLMNDGLIGDPSKVRFDKSGQAAQFNPGALKGSDVFSRDPTEWVKSVLLPAFVAKGIISRDTYGHALAGTLNDTEKQLLNTEIGKLGNTNTGKLLSTIATSLSQISRDSLNASRSQGVEGSVRAAQGTARGQEIGLHAQLTNLRLNLGVTLLPTYVSLLQKANVVLDKFNGFVRAHPRLTRAATVGILATTGALAAAVPVLLVAGTALSAYGNLTAIAARRTALLEAAQVKATAATIMETEAQAGANLASAGRAQAILGLLNPFRLFRTVGVGAIRAVGGALAFLMSPVGLVVGALVVGGFLVWKYWRPIAAFLTGFGQGLSEAFRPARPLFTQLVAWIKPVVTWFENLLTPVQDTGAGFRGATEAGVRFGRTVGGIIQWVVDKIGALISGIGTVGNVLAHPVTALEHFFGGGGQQPAYTDLPNFRAQGASVQGGDVTHNHTYNITQQPGQSAMELAQHVNRLSQQNSRGAPALADGPDGVIR
ncbi:phage tail tape measure protein [Bombella pollinis]|uniref:Phage tail tape measure protein n=1 Tax=Bombella pollinis TaxID=2967337 RepID=A0ABT3WQD8_9PROT|nr:hypothetical protein [Bombella pollinis]MCX5619922.1 hypothetical protein [Bombella pollinis]